MKAIITHPDTKGKIIQVNRSMPKPKNDEVLIKVKAFGINRADILQTLKLYPLPPNITDILGLEFGGEIVEVGHEVSHQLLGQKVCALADGGAYAEYITVKASMLMIFNHIDIIHQAAIPESFLTAYQCLFTLGNLKAHQKVLIHAAAGSVGSSAIQLAKHQHAIVTATCSTSKLQICQKLRAELVIDYQKTDFVEQIIAHYGESSIDMVLDFIGSSYAQQHIKVLNKDAKWILIGLLGGAKVDHLDLRPFLFKRISLQGTTLRGRSQDYKHLLTKAFYDNFAESLEDKSIYPLIDSIQSWQKVEECFEKMTNNQSIGKMICLVD